MNIERRRSVTFVENEENSIIEYNRDDEIQSFIGTIEIGVQTDDDWLEVLKQEIVKNVVKDQKSRGTTIRSQATKKSTLRSRRTTNLNQGSLKEQNETELSKKGSSRRKSQGSSNTTNSTTTSADGDIPAYPEMIVNDEFGVPYDLSSSDEENKVDIQKLSAALQKTQQTNQELTQAETPPIDTSNATDKTNETIENAGLPSTLRPPKELQAQENDDANTPTPEQILEQVMQQNLSKDKQQAECEYCHKPINDLPTKSQQMTDTVDQSEVFCCQQYRNLVEFAIKQQSAEKTKEGTSIDGSKQNLISITPGKGFKSTEQVAEEKVKSEKKIREKLLARQQASLLAAQKARQHQINAPRRAYTDFAPMMARQMKVINYQLSSCQFLEDGWTVRPASVTPQDFLIRQEIENMQLDMDLSSPLPLSGKESAIDRRLGLLQEIFTGISGVEFNEDTASLNYPGMDKSLLRLFGDGSGNIYYPSGNVAMVIIRDSADGSVNCVIRNDTARGTSTAKLLGIISTKGYGSVSFEDGSPRLIFDTVMGVELSPKDNSRKRHWYWEGEPHLHGPPFQPIFCSLNRYIGLKIASQNSVVVNFTGLSRHLHINLGCRHQNPKQLTQKLLSANKISADKFMIPLVNLRNRIGLLVERAHTANQHPKQLLATIEPLDNTTKSTIQLIKRKPQLSSRLEPIKTELKENTNTSINSTVRIS